MCDAAATAHDAAGSDPLRRGVPPGSLRYYAVLFAPADRRATLNALYSLEAELRDCSLASNHDVAHTRLEWWREECDRYAAGRARHPITVALAALRDPIIADPTALLQQLVVGAQLDLARYAYRTWAELHDYCRCSAGALQTSVAIALAHPDPVTTSERDFAVRLGSAVRQVEMLRDMALNLRRGLDYAPLELLEAHRIDRGAWQLLADPVQRRSVFDEWAARIDIELRDANSSLEGIERTRQRHGLVLRALHERLLLSVRSTGSNEALAVIAPLTKLWTAWRAALRAH